MDTLAILLRLGTYGVLSLVAGVPLFLWLSLGPVRGREMFGRLRVAHAVLLLTGTLLAVLSLIVTAATMAGTPILPIDWEMVSLVISATAAGKAILLRAAILLLAIAFALLNAPRLTALLGILALATLAWSGHAAAGEGVSGWLHLGADILHLLAAALWIGGMACLLLSLRHTPNHITRTMLQAFALIGSVTVATLIATGIVNSLMILGPEALPSLLGTTYGRLLTLKIAAFFAMLMLAANNRFRLTPAFERDGTAAAPLLRRAVGVEIGLAFLILALVAWLGSIDPHAAA